MVTSVYNHKGGTGKTTTTINLGRALKDLGYNILLVDLDPQANLTYSLGVEKKNAYEVTLSSKSVVKTNEGLDLLPNFASPDFLVDYEFPSVTALGDELANFFSEYDFVFIDCPPAMNMTVVNALLASDSVLITVLLDALSLEGLSQVLDSMSKLLIDYNKNISLTGVLPVMVNSSRHLTRDVKNYIKENINATLFENHIRMNVKIAEAPSHGKSVIEYDPKCNGSKDYKELANEFLELIKL